MSISTDTVLKGLPSFCISLFIFKINFINNHSDTNRYRNESYRKYQFFAYAGWNGGLYISATMQGTRGGGAMAAAWTAMMLHVCVYVGCWLLLVS